MKTILVPTDFSTNSKAGIRFALYLASKTPCKLVFYSAIELVVLLLDGKPKKANSIYKESLIRPKRI